MYDKCKDSEQKCLESFLFCAKSCKIHKKVILSFLETTFLNEGFVILDKQKKRAGCTPETTVPSLPLKLLLRKPIIFIAVQAFRCIKFAGHRAPCGLPYPAITY